METETLHDTKMIELEASIAENWSTTLTKSLTEKRLYAVENEWMISLLQTPSRITIAVRRCTSSKQPFPVRYSVGLKTRDGNIEEKACGILEDYKRQSSLNPFTLFFIEREELFRRKAELLSFDGLMVTVTCKLSRISHSELENIKSLKLTGGLIGLNMLSENIKGLFTGGEFCDVTLNVMNREFKAHKSILAARSPVFASYFKHDSLEKEKNVVNIPDCDSDSFPEFLEYLYSGKIENISFCTAVHLYKTADKYDVQELKTLCVECMIYNLSMSNYYDVLSLGELHDDIRLLAAITEFFTVNFDEIERTDEWKNLLRSNSNLAVKLFNEISPSVQVESKRRRLE